ncbi:MAG: hypothetical protein MI923_30460 [Phycisphaerales bacterium]|nr:hypothetical protein [Phycisphaerales bacterium]
MRCTSWQLSPRLHETNPTNGTQPEAVGTVSADGPAVSIGSHESEVTHVENYRRTEDAACREERGSRIGPTAHLRAK